MCVGKGSVCVVAEVWAVGGENEHSFLAAPAALLLVAWVAPAVGVCLWRVDVGADPSPARPGLLQEVGDAVRALKRG